MQPCWSKVHFRGNAGSAFITNSKKQLVTQAFLGSDILTLIAAQFCVLAIHADDYGTNGLFSVLTIRINLLNAVMMFGFIAYWLMLLRLVGSAVSLTHESVWWKHVGWISFAALINAILFLSFAQTLDISVLTLDYILYSTLLLIAFTFIGRVSLSGVLNAIHFGDNNVRHVIILGIGKEAQAYAHTLNNTQHSNVNLVGFIYSTTSCKLDEARVPSDKIIGSIGDFEAYYLNHVIDDIVICLPFGKYEADVTEFIELVLALGLSLKWSLMDILPIVTQKTRLEFTSEKNVIIPQLVIYSGHTFNLNYVAKRLIDTFLSAFVLIASSPILLMAIVAIKITSPGKAIFAQKRYGYNGRVIDVLKLRTMVANAPALQDALRETNNEMDGAAFKIKNDPRVTSVGKFLRKLSIDELPQLINVLKGDMSIVGPRPLPLEDYKRFTEITHRRRLSVLPGITGPWQVSGRNNISFDKWMELDIDYIENWTVWTDIKLILLTVPAVIFGRGAS